MSKITIEHNPSEERLKELGVSSWAIWEKEISKFPSVRRDLALLLDKKITYKELEELAQTLFKQWFIDFEFLFKFLGSQIKTLFKRTLTPCGGICICFFLLEIIRHPRSVFFSFLE